MIVKETEVFSKKTFSVKLNIFSFLLFLCLLVEILTVPSAQAQIIEGFPNTSTRIVREACTEALQSDDLSDLAFIKTPCGMYMLGYAHAAFATLSTLTSGNGYSEDALRVIKRTPFCVEKFVKLSDLAKFFVDESKLRGDMGDTHVVLGMALHKKYPCDKFFKETDREFEAHGVVPSK